MKLLFPAVLALLPALALLQDPAAPRTAARAQAEVATALMFEGQAEEALELYVSLFEDSKVESLEYWGPEGPGPEGKIKVAWFTLGGRRYMVSDSVDHPFTFTPSMSFFVTCKSAAEFERVHAELARDGEVLMPPDDYGFSARFAWCNDRFGVSWQLNLPRE